MFGLDTLNVLIGLVTVYLAFGVACTAVVEAIAAWLSVRSSNLESALSELLAGQLNQTTLVRPGVLRPSPREGPQQGKGRAAVVHSTRRSSGASWRHWSPRTEPRRSLAEAVDALPGTPDTNRIKGLLGALVAETRGDAAAFRKAVETHFDSVMDRAAGWFKRYAHNVGLVVAAALVIAANVDTVDLATALASSPAARTKMLEIAEGQLKAATDAETDGRGPGQAGQTEAASAAEPGEGAVGGGPGGR